jgi:hypothetical protein
MSQPIKIVKELGTKKKDGRRNNKAMSGIQILVSMQVF